MKLTASQLRQIIREELSETSVGKNPDKGMFKVGQEEFNTQRDAAAYADKIAGMSGWESDISVVNDVGEKVYTAEEGAKGKLIDEGQDYSNDPQVLTLLKNLEIEVEGGRQFPEIIEKVKGMAKGGYEARHIRDILHLKV